MRIIHALKKFKNPAKAQILQRFFKTGKGQYAEGDVFWGITVPVQRRVARQCIDMSLEELDQCMKYPVHEVRLTALIVLTELYARAVKMNDAQTMKNIFDFYVTHAAQINNWDLVDVSAPSIVGHFVYIHPKKKKILYTFARSRVLWKRRIAIVATLYLIKQKELSDTFAIAALLLEDTHDLLHKAVGWMLREAGKISLQELEAFLLQHKGVMPRTALRYAIERMPEVKRRQYLAR